MRVRSSALRFHVLRSRAEARPSKLGKERQRTVARFALSFALLLAATGAHAELSPTEQNCINTFGKSVRDVGKAQGKVVKYCLHRFAAGALLTPPEACLLSDPANKVTQKSAGATGKILNACAAAPPFGISPTGAAISRAAVGEIDLMHAAIGANLDTALVSDPDVASCQSRVGAVLLKCHDARWRAFLKCQKSYLRAGLVTDPVALELSCLSAHDGEVTPADPTGRVAKLCGEKLTRTVTQQCESVDLTQAFPVLQQSAPASAVGALVVRSRCEHCRAANEIGDLSRDCDDYDDDLNNGSCGPECGDGVIQDGEGCDDGDADTGDGCSSACGGEAGWSCTGEPSVCTPSCGNGQVDAGEGCDDTNISGSDGCSPTCQVEPNHTCTGAPSVCTHNCGNGTLQSGGGEACDDGDRSGGDGCSATCQVEEGYLCTGQPSACTFVCGNGTFQSGETCDDDNAVAGDGCSAGCRIETGWLCSGQPSLCTPLCGDGLKRGGETCDDGDAVSADGCSFSCQAESGFSCIGQPSNCVAICGDGFRRGLETCDDGNTADNDGCSGSLCRLEPGSTCVGQPSICFADCGDGNLDPLEECDDGGVMPGDGCDAECRGEPGHACGGQPSVCAATCGNSLLQSGESCDDGNAVSGDGCSASCRNEPGWFCGGPGSACQRFEVIIDTPLNGAFTTAASTVITGRYTTLPPGSVSLTINGTPASSVNQGTRTFSHTVPLNTGPIFNPIRAVLANTATGDTVIDRIVVVNGPSVADGTISPQSVALRMNDSGIDAIEPLVGGLAAGQFDLATLVPSGTVVLPWQCYFSFIWCWAGAEARIGSPPPSFGGIRFAADSNVGEVAGDVMIDNLRIDIHIDGTGIVPDCGLRLSASEMRLSGDYALSPDASDPSFVNVDLVELRDVTFTNFNHQFIYGSCGLVSSRLGDVEQLASGAIGGFIADPDGSGPVDSPIADAIEEALAGVSIAGAVGSGLGLSLDAPLFQVAEDAAGITLGAGARFTVSVGSGPGQCLPPPGTPNLTASYAPAETFPSFGAITPGGLPYGVAVAISTAGMNQLLRGQTECGLLRTSLATIDLDGAGGAPPTAITAGLLALLAPEFSQLPPSTPLRIDVAPTLAPLVTGAGGPGGEITELKVAQVMIEFVEPGSETVWLSAALDARLGMDLEFLPDGAGLGIVLTEPAPADATIVIVYNPLGANAAQLEAVLPALIRPMIPELAGALAGFPLPQFFGLFLDSIEVSRNGQFLSLFANLAPVP